MIPALSYVALRRSRLRSHLRRSRARVRQTCRAGSAACHAAFSASNRALAEINCFVGQSLSLDAEQRRHGAAEVINAKGRAVVIPEIELSGIPLQMLAADVVINAGDAALEDAEE